MTATGSTTQPSLSMRERMTDYINSLQDTIVTAIEALEPGHKFLHDSWQRPQGGSGKSCILAVPNPEPGIAPSIFEKAGINISIVHGMLPPAAIQQMRANHSEIPYDPKSGKSLPFFAAGLSLVIHPRNPFAPTVHANYRYFEITEAVEPAAGEKEKQDNAQILAWWFGGGSDLTPSYLFPEDASHFHKTLKTACDAHGEAVYPVLKKWCDEYFYIPHRSESRGIGGIFFDDLSSAPHDRLPNTGRPSNQEEIFAFVRACGDAFVPSYLPILHKRIHTPFTDRHRRWQLLRRGRYVEFNLVYDRGTKFGLNTPGARIESILMSLPETARWEYMSDMGEDGEEQPLMEVLRKPREWA